MIYQGTLELLRSKWTESTRDGVVGSWWRCWKGLLERWRGRPQEPEPEYLTPREPPTPSLLSSPTSPEFGSCKNRCLEGRGRTMERRTSRRREWWAWADDLV
jgi:hypothetical protein